MDSTVDAETEEQESTPIQLSSTDAITMLQTFSYFKEASLNAQPFDMIAPVLGIWIGLGPNSASRRVL